MSRRTVKPSWAERVFGEAFAHGWGLPLTLFALSAIISVGGLWAWLTAAETAGALAPLYVFAGAFQFCAQWAANCGMLRMRRNEGAARIGFGVLYLICALLAGSGVYHVSYVAREPAWRAEVQHRAEQRAPFEQTIRDANATIAAANAEILAIAQTARLEQWPGERAQRQAAPSREIIEDARRSIAEANAALEPIPALSETRPLDWLDTIMLIGALLTVIVEGVGYFGMLGEGKKTQAPKKRGRAEQRNPGISDVLARALARALLGPATAAAMFTAATPPSRRETAPAEETRKATEVVSISAAAAALGRMSGASRRARGAPQPQTAVARAG